MNQLEQMFKISLMVACAMTIWNLLGGEWMMAVLWCVIAIQAVIIIELLNPNDE